jgi:hypothetical protein
MKVNSGVGPLLGLVLTTAACGGGEGAVGWDGTVTDSAGITIIQNGSSGVWGDTPGWTLAEVLRIGNEFDPEYQFGIIGGIAPLSDGRVVVLDQQAQNLRVYDAAGQFLSEFADAGSGPGELSQATAVLRGAADTVYVPGWAGIDIFAPNGESVGRYTRDRLWGSPHFWDSTPSGRLFYLEKPGMPGQPRADSLDAIVELGAEGVTIDTLFRMPPGEGVTFPEVRVQFRMYGREPAWRLYGDNGLLLGWSDEYSIHHYGTDGSLQRIIRKPFERQEVTSTDQRVFIDVLRQVWSDQGIPPNMVRWYEEGVSFGAYLPALSRILAGPNGTIWVQRVLAPSELTLGGHRPSYPFVRVGSVEWDVFDADGRFMGMIEFPQAYEPLVFRENLVYGIWRDELDTQSVMVLSVEQAAP